MSIYKGNMKTPRRSSGPEMKGLDMSYAKRMVEDRPEFQRAQAQGEEGPPICEDLPEPTPEEVEEAWAGSPPPEETPDTPEFDAWLRDSFLRMQSEELRARRDALLSTRPKPE